MPPLSSHPATASSRQKARRHAPDRHSRRTGDIVRSPRQDRAATQSCASGTGAPLHSRERAQPASTPLPQAEADHHHRPLRAIRLRNIRSPPRAISNGTAPASPQMAPPSKPLPAATRPARSTRLARRRHWISPSETARYRSVFAPAGRQRDHAPNRSVT